MLYNGKFLLYVVLPASSRTKLFYCWINLISLCIFVVVRKHITYLCTSSPHIFWYSFVNFWKDTVIYLLTAVLYPVTYRYSEGTFLKKESACCILLILFQKKTNFLSRICQLCNIFHSLDWPVIDTQTFWIFWWKIYRLIHLTKVYQIKSSFLSFLSLFDTQVVNWFFF